MGEVQDETPPRKSQEKIAGFSNGKTAWVEAADMPSVSNRLSVPGLGLQWCPVPVAVGGSARRKNRQKALDVCSKMQEEKSPNKHKVSIDFKLFAEGKHVGSTAGLHCLYYGLAAWRTWAESLGRLSWRSRARTPSLLSPSNWTMPSGTGTLCLWCNVACRRRC